MAKFSPEIRGAAYAHLGLDVPKNGAGAIIEGLTVVEHTVATGGFNGRTFAEVEVVELGVHVLATGGVAKDITGDAAVQVVSYGRNPNNGQVDLTVVRETNGKRETDRIKDSAHPLRSAVAQGLKPYLELPRQPFTRKPDVDLRQTSVNGRASRGAVLVAR